VQIETERLGEAGGLPVEFRGDFFAVALGSY
jgi:hypothetical protein